MANYTQVEFLDALASAREVTSPEMQALVNRLPPAEMLAVADVAAALGVGTSTVYGLIQSGELRALNLGTTAKPYYRVFRVSVLCYIKRRMV